MLVSKDLKVKTQMTREDGVFTLKLDEGVSLAMLLSFAQDMFPGVGTEDSGRWRAGGLGARWRNSYFELKGVAMPLAVG